MEALKSNNTRPNSATTPPPCKESTGQSRSLRRPRIQWMVRSKQWLCNLVSNQDSKKDHLMEDTLHRASNRITGKHTVRTKLTFRELLLDHSLAPQGHREATTNSRLAIIPIVVSWLEGIIMHPRLFMAGSSNSDTTIHDYNFLSFSY